MTENNVTVLELPEQMRPRERLLKYGEETLASHELLAILLRTGTRKYNAIQLSMLLLSEFETLYELKSASCQDLMQLPGIGEVKAVEIKAAIEFGSRVGASLQVKYGMIQSTAQAGQYFLEALKDKQQEHVLVFYLNTKNQIIKKQTVFIGGLNMSVAHPREIFREAVRYSSARIVLGHNHPSGNPEPSPADIQFTERLIECGNLLGIEVLDHLVVGNDSFISLREYGVFT